ncbi:hypothetical protein BZG36_03626 [Bifiguratus adelaidae]|uniref:Major facilitator superfamily (MFS) profile domain-containing protein n=1 Tax=Bifiguratus adelaidae TaxID=1938954 RepID=A0A261Y075_9FUNG|nr:hypothetical protein BZG36_03626 [Bifiguratus adelaidae]
METTDDNRTLTEADGQRARHAPMDLEQEEAALEKQQEIEGEIIQDRLVFPDGGLQAWLVVLGGACAFFVSFGLSNAWGVIETYYLQTLLPNRPESDISWIGSFQFFGMFLGCGLCGPLFDRFGARWIMIVSSTLFVFSIMMASLATEYYQFFLTQGVLQGMTGGMLFNCSVTATNHWFLKKRGVALGIVAAGSSLGGIIWPIALDNMLNNTSSNALGFGWSLRIIGFICLVLLIPACFFVKGRLPRRNRIVFWDSDAVKNPQFVTFAIGIFITCLGFYIPFFYVTIASIQDGVDPTLAFYLLALLNGVSIFGRVIPGLLADRFGRFNIMFVACFTSGILTLLWLTSTETWEIILFTCAFGFASGAVVSLIGACPAQLCPYGDRIGLYVSMVMYIGSLGCLLGPPIGGWIVGAQHGAYWGAKLFSGVMIVAGSLLIGTSRLLQDRRLLAVK